MADYKTPGIYIEEVSSLPPSVVSAETAIPAFIGYTETGAPSSAAEADPVKISSMLEYTDTFGYGNAEAFTVTLDADDNITDISPTSALSGFTMYYALKLFFENGGADCYIVSVGDYTSTISDTDLKSGLDTLEREDEPTMILFPDAPAIADLDSYYSVYQQALSQCSDMKDRITLIDTMTYGDSVDTGNTDAITAIDDLRNKIGTQYLSYGAAYYPWLETIYSYSYEDSGVTISQATRNNSLTPYGGTLADYSDTALSTYDSGFTATVRSALEDEAVTLAPSSAIAGIYTTVDNDRGVWKAPANISLNSVAKTTVKINDSDQASMNVDATSGKSVNAIRYFSGQGNLVWGARTLDGNSSEWRYVSTRRFFAYVEDSLRSSTQWAVFQPNDSRTWVALKGLIRNFLSDLWRQGALTGAKEEEAFFVNLGQGSTMTQQDVLDGKLIIEIGMSVVRPAEFIILRFSHYVQTT
ncbi:MAG: phage tail sheath C-terminal domain-containing protein [Bacteroidota bacterium]